MIQKPEQDQLSKQQQEQEQCYDITTLLTKLQTIDWSDVDTPILATPNLLDQNFFVIEIPVKYQKAYTRFQNLRISGQISQRVYILTQALLVINVSNYYALMMRRKCFEQLKPNLKSEINFINYLLEMNSKEYHLWTYKKILCNRQNLSDTIQFLDELLEDDRRNYHVWSFRIWLTMEFEYYAKQLEWSNRILKENWRYHEVYSFWSYRFFLILKLKLMYEPSFKQISFVLNHIEKNPNNECLWNYLHGFFMPNEFKKFEFTNYKYVDFPEVEQFVKKIKKNRFSLYAQYQINEEKGDKEKQIQNIKELITLDKVRERYWNHILQQIEGKVSLGFSSSSSTQ